MSAHSTIDLLLVEDNPMDLELILRSLRKVLVLDRIHTVRDGAEALNFLMGQGEYAGRGAEQPPRVVLLDLKLPKVGGLEVLEIIRQDARTRTIPVVVLTSSAEKRDVISSYRLGANSYIVKPVNFDAFEHAVQQVGVYWLSLNLKPEREGR